MLKNNLYILPSNAKESNDVKKIIQLVDSSAKFSADKEQVNINNELLLHKNIIEIVFDEELKERFDLATDTNGSKHHLKINKKLLYLKNEIGNQKETHIDLLAPKLASQIKNIINSRTPKLPLLVRDILPSELQKLVQQKIEGNVEIISVDHEAFLNQKEILAFENGIDYLSKNDFREKHQNEIKSIIDKLRHIKAKTVLIEGAHIYANKKVTKEHCVGFQSMKFMVDILKETGFEIKTQVFVDDYNIEGGEYIFNEQDYLKLGKKMGIHVDHLQSESNMTEIANDILSYFMRNNTVSESDNYWLKCENVSLRLTTDSHDKNLLNGKKRQKYSCALLDAALSLCKLHDSDATLNIVPSNFRNQQNNMKKIISRIADGGHKRILNLYI